jgi:hypothetical protein
MPFDPNRIEIERIRNLLTGFGWEIAKEEITDTDIILVLKRPRIVPGPVGAGPS